MENYSNLFVSFRGQLLWMTVLLLLLLMMIMMMMMMMMTTVSGQRAFEEVGSVIHSLGSCCG